MLKNRILPYLLLMPIFFIFSLILIAMNGTHSSSFYQDSHNQFSGLSVITQKMPWGKDIPIGDLKQSPENIIKATFKAQTDNLGIIAVSFNTWHRSISGRIIFRLKEDGQNNWYTENTYNTNQIQTDIPFPFGFPEIKNSKNKSYTFEIESLAGTKDNSISPSKSEFYFLSEYKFTKGELVRNPYTLIQFIFFKSIDYIPFFNSKDIILIFLITISPILAYFMLNLGNKILYKVHFFEEKARFPETIKRQSKKVTKSLGYIYGIDYLRVIFCISVVMWHEIGKNSPLPHNSATTLSEYLTGIFHLDFLLFAVPSFLLVSCFLFLYKGGTLDRLKTNSKRLLILFLFWAFITDLLVGDTKDIIFFLSPHNLTALFTLISGGAFGLYYFIISLIVVQTLTYFFRNVRFLYIVAGLVISTAIIFSLSYYAESTGNSLYVQYFSPVNFILVPFLALILYNVWKFKDKTKMLVLIFFLLLGILSRVLEWYLLIHLFFIHNIQPGFPLYARPSLYFLSMSLIILSFFIFKKPPFIISFISSYSLAIYVIHILFLSLSRQITESMAFLSYFHLNDLITTLICVAFAIVFARVFFLFIRKEILFS